VAGAKGEPMERTQAAKIVRKDVSGARLFCDGALGFAHVMAHRLLDAQQPEEGRRALGRWLDGREGSGSDWVHVQWHMAVFEIEMGRWSSASKRFWQHIEPAFVKCCCLKKIKKTLMIYLKR